MPIKSGQYGKYYEWTDNGTVKRLSLSCYVNSKIYYSKTTKRAISRQPLLIIQKHYEFIFANKIILLFFFSFAKLHPFRDSCNT